MADETTQQESNTETQQQAAPATTVQVNTDLDALKAQHQAELAAARAELEAHKQTLQAVQSQLGGGAQPQMVQAGGYAIPRQVVDEFTRNGMSEKDAIDAAKVLMPFLNTYGAPLAQQQLQIAADTKYVRAAMDKATYPDWGLLGETIDSLRAKYPGIEPKDAYDWARGIAYDKVVAARESERAASARASDATASTFMGAGSPHTRIDLADKTVRSAADILTLSDDEAQKLWDQVGNRPF